MTPKIPSSDTAPLLSERSTPASSRHLSYLIIQEKALPLQRLIEELKYWESETQIQRNKSPIMGLVYITVLDRYLCFHSISPTVKCAEEIVFHSIRFKLKGLGGVLFFLMPPTGVRPQSKVASDCILAPDPRPAGCTSR